MASKEITLHVEHCVKCQGYGAKFRKFRKHFVKKGLKVLSNPQESEPGKQTFEVSLEGKQLLFSKVKFGRFPTEADYLDIFKQANGEKTNLSSELGKINDMPEITQEEFKKLEKDAFILVDCRDKSSGYFDKTIEGCKRLNMNALLLDAVHGDIDEWKKKKLIIFCDCGFLAKICVEKLNDMGFDSYNLRGGYFLHIGKEDWATCCLPKE